jgi:putative FmdB family regulatory protein
MPIYEYRCNNCGGVTSFLLLRPSEAVDPYCKACGSKGVARVISRVFVPRSEERRMEGLLDPARFSDLDENDPVSIERAARRMGEELGEDFNESMEEALAAGVPTEEQGF